MSVPTWNRELSKTQYLFDTYKLAIRIGEIVMRKPTKYRPTYGDRLINDSLNAYRYAYYANSIFMGETTSEEDYKRRREYLRNAMLLIDGLSTTADIFLSLNYNLDGANKDQLNRQYEYIGSTTASIHKMIKGVMDSDTKVFKGKK